MIIYFTYMNYFNGLLLIEFAGNTVYDYLFSLGIFVLIFLLIQIFKIALSKIITGFLKKTSSKYDDIVIGSIIKLLSLAGLVVGLFFAINHLKLSEEALGIVNKAYVILLSLFTAYFVQVLVNKILDEYFRRLTDESKSTFVSFIKNIVDIFIWIIAIIFILSNLGYQITSLAAGLGIGGLAVALALKPTLEAFFASVTVITDKPFRVGDVIRYGSSTGTVKYVGLRSTRIETLAGTELIIPNTEIIAKELENLTKRSAVRFDTKIGIEYSSSSKNINLAIKTIRDFLSEVDEVIAKDTRVTFDTFGDSALIISVTYFLDASLSSTDLSDIVSSINIEIKSRLEKNQISFAFPSQTVYLKK